MVEVYVLGFSYGIYHDKGKVQEWKFHEQYYCKYTVTMKLKSLKITMLLYSAHVPNTVQIKQYVQIHTIYDNVTVHIYTSHNNIASVS